MKTMVLTLVAVLTAALTVAGQAERKVYDLPELNKTQTVTLSPSYSCRSKEETAAGYAGTSIFLTPFTKERNSPDLVFNGACRSEDYFMASTAGDDMSVIADLGKIVAFEGITASTSFNLKSISSFDEYSKFAGKVKIKAGHTYAVLLNKAIVRGLLLVNVVNHVPNQSVEIRYAVKHYQIYPQNEIVRSAGFDWEKGNQ